jgi:hypothetical protein
MLKTIMNPGGIAVICVLSFIYTSGLLAANDDGMQQRSTPELKMRGIALPASWKAEAEKHADTHTDAEWQAPSGHTVFGAVYIHVPPLVGGKSLVKQVKKNYVKRQPGGKMTQQWTDAADRNWFEVDATGTHTKGFVITHGHHAWFVYYRYATGNDSAQDEIKIADDAINHVEPTAD